MTGIEKMRTRLNYQGGVPAQDRMIEDKLKTLKKALLYSYQANTIELADGRQFRALINEDKLNKEYDDKILSIPFEDICLNKQRQGKTSQGIEPINLKMGEVFHCLDTDTYWITYLRYLEEKAYLRADIRLCNEEVEINGKAYKVYLRGPAETTLQWNQKKSVEWNDLNYSLVMYITKDDNTLDFFHRFTKIKINGNTWQVTVINPYYCEGIIKVCLDEYYNNDLIDLNNKPEIETPIIEQGIPAISGPLMVSPYDTVEYKIEYASGGEWFIEGSKAKLKTTTELTAIVNIVSGRSGQFDIIYRKDGKDICKSNIIIKSL